MPHPLLRSRAALLAALAVFAAAPAAAQQFTYGDDERRASQSVSVGYTLLDFEYNGDGAPRASFAFTEPAFGLVYTRPNLHASVAFAEQAAAADTLRPLRLLDFSLTTWGEFFGRGGRGAGASRLYLPLALHSDYRRIAAKGEENSLTEAFNVTALGLGIGGGYEAMFGDRVAFEARAIPIIGLALRSFGDSAGSTWLVDTDALLHVSRLAGRLGLSLGYGFRYQVWNGAGSTLLGTQTEDLFDYKGSQHVFRVGVNW